MNILNDGIVVNIYFFYTVGGGIIMYSSSSELHKSLDDISWVGKHGNYVGAATASRSSKVG